MIYIYSFVHRSRREGCQIDLFSLFLNIFEDIKVKNGQLARGSYATEAHRMMIERGKYTHDNIKK